MVLAALAMAPLAWLTARAFTAAWGVRGLAAQATTGLVPVIVGVGAYALFSWVLRVPEATTLQQTLATRWRRGKPGISQ